MDTPQLDTAPLTHRINSDVIAALRFYSDHGDVFEFRRYLSDHFGHERQSEILAYLSLD